MGLSIYCWFLDFFFRALNTQKSASNYNISESENNLFWNLSFISSIASSYWPGWKTLIPTWCSKGTQIGMEFCHHYLLWVIFLPPQLLETVYVLFSKNNQPTKQPAHIQWHTHRNWIKPNAKSLILDLWEQ